MLSESGKKAVYECLTAKMALNKKYSLSQAVEVLNSAKIDHRQFGYLSSEAMLVDMKESISLSKGFLGLKKYVELHTWEPSGEADPNPQDSDSTKHPIKERTETFKDKDAPPVKSAYDYSVPPETLEGILSIPKKQYESLQALVANISSQELIQIIYNDYAHAKENKKIRKYKDNFDFPLSIKDQNGVELTASIAPNHKPGNSPWWLRAIGKMPPGKQLQQFAYLGNRAEFLSELAALALPEQWDFQSEQGSSDKEAASYGILDKYIRYTFYRLSLENKICISEDEQFAAFNTGLVTEHYEDIFACFVPNNRNLQAWVFKEFTNSASGRFGKRLVETFNPLPQTASYIECMEHLLFDINKDLHVNYEHIILDNAGRLPLPFLRDNLHDLPEGAALLDKIEKTNVNQRKPLYENLKDLLGNNNIHYLRIYRRINDAIELAKKQVRWNYKTAVPSYYPRANTMSLMLPLCLQQDGKADAALVVELTKSGNYQGQTILTLQQAYNNARLLCRPNSEWLDTRKITSSGMGEDEDDV